MVRGVLGEVVQSNARFGLKDRIEVYLDHVRVPAGNGRMSEKTKVRSLNLMGVIEKRTVVVMAAFLRLAH